MNRIFNNRPSVFAAVIGTALESYDLMLFAHFLFILVPLFFPPAESATLMGFATFAIGTIFRPLGGTLFGHIGDRWGRKKTLVLTLFLSSIPTCFIGLLPSYVQIGFLATSLLIIFRILQNVSMVGEATGAGCILMEQTNPGHRAFSSSLINAAANLGGILATIAGYVCIKYLPEWGWRVPFIIAAALGLIGFYIRSRTTETPIFSEIKAEQKIEKIPLFSVLKNNLRSIFCTFGLCAAVMAPAQIVYVYLGDLLRNKIGLVASDIMLVNTGIMTLGIIALVSFGWIADRIGSKLLMLISTAILCIASYPLFWLINRNMDAASVITTGFIIGFLSAGFTAPIYVIIAFMFPPGRRYTGIAFSWGVGSVIFAGCSPLICKLLEQYTGDHSSPGIFLMLCSFLGFLAVYNARHYQESLDLQKEAKFDDIVDSLDYYETGKNSPGLQI